MKKAASAPDSLGRDELGGGEFLANLNEVRDNTQLRKSDEYNDYVLS